MLLSWTQCCSETLRVPFGFLFSFYSKKLGLGILTIYAKYHTEIITIRYLKCMGI